MYDGTTFTMSAQATVTSDVGRCAGGDCAWRLYVSVNPAVPELAKSLHCNDYDLRIIKGRGFPSPGTCASYSAVRTGAQRRGASTCGLMLTTKFHSMP